MAMTDIESTFQPRFTRCRFCSRIYDVAVSAECPECRRLQTLAAPAEKPTVSPEKPPASDSTAGPAPPAAKRSRLGPRIMIASALVALPLAALGAWLALSGGERADLRKPAGIIVLSPAREHREERAPTAEARRLTLKPGEAFKECDVCPEMVVVPGGSFLMGSSTTEEGSSADERPQHTVTIGGNLAVGKFEVTIRQFLEFLNAAVQEGKFSESWIATAPETGGAPIVRSGVRFSVKAEDEQLPVTFVSWNGAVAYAGWVSKRANTPYRLLSEAEWEYAARAGSRTAYYFGDDALRLCEHANVGDHTAMKKSSFSPVTDCDDGFAGLAPVGKFKPNAFGLYDMLGNAAEWIEDCWHRSYEGAPNDGSAWTSGDCRSRAFRGGSYNGLPIGLRSAQRYFHPATTRSTFIGLRLARPIPP